MIKRNQLISFGIICFFLTIGALPSILQYNTIHSYKPVQAIIESSKTVKYQSGNSRVSYLFEPLVVYSYRVKGREYISSRVFPRRMRMKGDFEWAREIRYSFRKGNSVTAYYNPSSPSDALLIKRYSFTPFLWLFMTMAGITVLAMYFVYEPGSSKQPLPLVQVEGESGEFRLMATQTLYQTRALYKLLRYLWLIPGGVAFYFYFKTNPPYDLLAYWFAGINAIVFFVFLLKSIYYGRLWRHIIESFVSTSTGPFRLGHNLKITIRQGFKKPFQLKKIEVGLTCEQMTTIALRFKEGRPRKKLHNKWQTLANSRPVDVGDLLNFKVEFGIPSGLPVTTLSTSKEDPGYRWFLHYKLLIDGGMVLRYKYPILVK